MKTVLYFVMAIVSLIYVGLLCYLNVVPSAALAPTTWGQILHYVQLYGGVVIIFMFAFINFFGSPLKVIFFTVLIIVGIIFILTAVVPAWFGGVKAALGV